LRLGYAYPGDVGRLDEEGFLYVLGREIDVIFDGKRKFYPNEMERALNRCEGFQDVAIVGIPLGDNLKVPVAFTVLLPGVSRSDLVTSAASSLNAEHLPHDIVILDTLPRNQLGKVVRRALADGYVVPEQSIFDARGTEAVKMGLT
jgi:acyl-CoA synthetase (AMP-forming)/AMP-acid ligase II